ncbi:MAG TPA: L,D-transpeptidase family protein [Motilibacteraceae bacterium]|nr:L,D-transpeptidase family protein [Motilibacteraceae bacterium]
MQAQDEPRSRPRAAGARPARSPGRLALRVSGPLVLALPLAFVAGLALRGEDPPASAAEAPRPTTTAAAQVPARSATARPASPAAAPASTRPSSQATTSRATTSRATTSARPATTAAPTALPVNSGTGKRIVVSKSRQRVWLVGADGAVRRSYLVSGMRSQPDPGSYRVFVRQAATSSAVDDSTMKWFVGFTRGKYQGATIGFHDIPRTPDGKLEQTKAQLGTPLSAGCFRQWEDDAKALWAFAPIGTRVVVVG